MFFLDNGDSIYVSSTVIKRITKYFTEIMVNRNEILITRLPRKIKGNRN